MPVEHFATNEEQLKAKVESLRHLLSKADRRASEEQKRADRLEQQVRDLQREIDRRDRRIAELISR